MFHPLKKTQSPLEGNVCIFKDCIYVSPGISPYPLRMKHQFRSFDGCLLSGKNSDAKARLKKAWVQFKCAYCTVETQQPNQFLQELQTDHPKCSVGNSFWESSGHHLSSLFYLSKRGREVVFKLQRPPAGPASRAGEWVAMLGPPSGLPAWVLAALQGLGLALMWG